MEGEDPDEESDGFTLLKYMSRIGHNQFVWGNHVDRLKTNNADILLKVESPVPISSRFFGLPKEILKKVDKLFLVTWSIISTFILSFSRWGVDQHCCQHRQQCWSTFGLEKDRLPGTSTVRVEIIDHS